jgi:hypothetical protein
MQIFYALFLLITLYSMHLYAIIDFGSDHP